MNSIKENLVTDEKGSVPPPIFIGGAGRSGTTLLRVILDSHPQIACGPELNVPIYISDIWRKFQTDVRPELNEYKISPKQTSSILARAIQSFLENYRKHVGKRRIAEKSPHNVFCLVPLANMFPESPLIHMIRDGRDVVCSLLGMDWRDLETGQQVEYILNARKAAEYWVSAVRGARNSLKNPAVKRNYFEIKYEDLVQSPEATLKRLLDFIKEPWDPVVLDYHMQQHDLAGESSAGAVSRPLYNTSITRWKRDMNPRDRDIVKGIAGDLLIELGYADDLNW